MARLRSVLRWIGWGVAGFAAVFIVIGVAAYVYVQTEAGRHMLAETISTALSSPDQKVSVTGIGPNLPVTLSVSSLVVSDDQGPWLTVDEATIDWRPLALFQGRLHVTDIDVAGIDLRRLPPAAPPEDVQEEATAEPLEIPTLPIDVQVDRINIRDIALGEAVVGEAMVLHLSGQVAGEVGATVQTDLRLERTNAESVVTLDSELDPAAQTLSIDLAVSEPKGGLIARLLGLAPYPPVTVTLKGEGPLSAWRAKFDARIDGLADVTANLRVDREQVTDVSLEGRADVGGLLDPPMKPLVSGGVDFSLAAQLEDLDAVTVKRLSVDTKAVIGSRGRAVSISPVTNSMPTVKV